jgi:hypothetical protein
MLPSLWKPAEYPGPLVRIGAVHDGGYPISPAALKGSDVLLSMGLNDDWQFEEDFRRRSGARVICFDHTVTGRFWAKYTLFALMKANFRRARKVIGYHQFFSRPDVSHRRLKIGYDSPGSISLKSILADIDSENMFLKCDIEGGEYRIVDDIVENQRRFTGMAMEFHDVDLQRQRIDSFIRRLNDFTLVHVHANNFGGTDPRGDPLVIEVTFTRSDLINEGGGAQEFVEHSNNPAARDIDLFFEAS